MYVPGFPTLFSFSLFFSLPHQILSVIRYFGLSLNFFSFCLHVRSQCPSNFYLSFLCFSFCLLPPSRNLLKKRSSVSFSSPSFSSSPFCFSSFLLSLSSSFCFLNFAPLSYRVCHSEKKLFSKLGHF